MQLALGAVTAVAVPEPIDNTIKHVDLFNVMGKTQWLSLGADLITTSAHTVVRNSHLPVNITIANSITVESMQSIMRHTNIKHLHLQLGSVSADVIKAISDMVIQQSLVRKCVSSCTIDNFERLDAATIKILLQNMPETLHTLTIRQAQSCRFVKKNCDIAYCPSSVRSLSITHVAFYVVLPPKLEKLYTIDCSPLAWDSLPFKLLELHIFNRRSELPTLHRGLLKLQMHSLNKMTMDIPLEKIPNTVTHLKLAETQTIKVPEWPSQLQVLDVGAKYLHALGELPDTVTELYVKTNRYLTPRYRLQTIPPQLKVLDIRKVEFSPDVVLPNTLEILRQDMCSEPLPALPFGWKELKLSGYNCRQLAAALPATLQILDIGLAYSLNTVLDNSVLPASLHTLHVFEQYKYSLDNVRPSIQIHRCVPRYCISTGTIW
jgi:hypothetical protein